MAYKRLKSLLKNSYCTKVCYTTSARLIKTVDVSQLTKEELNTTYTNRQWMIKDKTIYLRKEKLWTKK